MVVFHNRSDVLLRTEDGRNFTIVEPIEVVCDDGARYRVPEGATSDGCSTPDFMWSIVPPFGTYFKAAIVHDSAYRGTLQRQLVTGEWVAAMLSKEQSDLLFLDCMTAVGVQQDVKELIYHGVSKLGWRAFRNDRLTPQP